MSGISELTPAEPTSTRGGWVRTPLVAVREVAALVLVEPVRDGRLRTRDWPPGLRAVAALALVALVGAAVLVVAAPSIRSHGDLSVDVGGDLIYPRWTTPIFLGLCVLTLSLLHTASLHLWVGLRLLALPLVALAILSLVLDVGDTGRASDVVSWIGCGLLALLTLARWRGTFRWWEFVASFVVIGGTVGVLLRLSARSAQPLGFDTAPLALVLTMQYISSLAVPFIFLAGLAFAQLSVLLVQRVGDVVEQRVPRTWVVAVVVLGVAAADVVLSARRLSRPSTSGHSHLAEALGGAVLLAAALTVSVLVVLRRVPPGGRPRERLDTSVSSVGLVVAVAITVTTLVALAVTRLDTVVLRYADRDGTSFGRVTDALYSSTAITLTRVALGVGLVVWAVLQRRRRLVPAAVAGSIGVTLLVTMARRVSGGVVDLPWTAASVTDAATVVTLLALVVLAASRRLTRRRWVALGVALGLSLAFAVRSSFDAPFVALFGLGATAAVFLGVVWATLTDADSANGDSPRWPRPARVLLFLANALLAMTTLAFTSVSNTYELSIDVSPFSVLGDEYLGTGLLLAAYAVLAWEVATAREPNPRC